MGLFPAGGRSLYHRRFLGQKILTAEDAEHAEKKRREGFYSTH
jgi:hypothetical protein